MSSGNKWKWTAGLTLFVLLAASARFLQVQPALQKALAWINELGHWGPVAFIAIYAAATVLFVPGSILTLGAGALFGIVEGSVYVSIASTLGAIAAFLIGRYLARDWVSRKIASREKFAAIDKAVAVEGWRIVGLVRLSPLFPFTLLNYAFGITRVSLRDYALASWIGMMPGTVMYVYLGSLARTGANPESRTATEWVLYGIGLLATIGVTVLITRAARRVLSERITP